MNDCYYSNCDLYKNNEHCMDSIEFCEYSLREHDAKIRADAIDEFAELLKHKIDIGYIFSHEVVDMIVEQLKEQKNEMR